MSDEKEKTAPVEQKKSGGGGRLLGVLLPAVVAGVAAFAPPAAASSEHTEAAKPPGVTLALEPFLLTIPDANRKVHPMKVTLAIEFDSSAKEDALKPLVPRVRDSTLGYLRTLTFEAALDPAASDKMRGEVLERVQGTAAPAAQRVLITDLVVQ